MIDETKDIDKIFKDNVNCIVYNSSNYLYKIEEILSNYGSYTHVKENGYNLSKNYTWNSWTENIVRHIGTYFFDAKIYTNLYDLPDLNQNQLLERWLSNGLVNKEICFDFTVPDIFNAVDYINDKKIKNDPKCAYLHWKINSKDDITYMNNNNKKMNTFYDIKCDNMEDYYNVCAILNKIIKYNTRDTGLDELHKYCNRTPYIKINEITSSFVNNML